MDDHSHGRRDLLKALGIGSVALVTPQYALARSILRNLFLVSEAEAAGLQSPRNYVNIFMSGGPSRLTFDHWMRTKADEPTLLQNDLMGNAFTYNSTTRQVTGITHKSMNFRGNELPHMFSFLSPAEQTQFLDQFLVIRGYGSGQDGHTFNAALQMHPLASEQSVSGLLADASGRQIEAVQYPARGSNSRFKSKSNIGMNVVNAGGNATALEALLAPAVITTGKSRILRNDHRDLFTQFRSMLSSSTDDRPATKIARQGLSNAYQLFSGSVADYASFWATTLPIYQAAIDSAMQSGLTLPGFSATNDGSQPLTLLPTASTKFNVSDGLSSFKFNQNSNMLLTNQQMTSVALAEGLTMAEYLIVNGLSSSMEISYGSATQLTRDTAIAYAANNSFTLWRDSHSQGAYPMMYILTLYYMGLTKGLLLFKNRLAATGHWNDTIVHVVSDFGRTNRADGSGSDHGFDSMSSSVFSGSFAGGPYVVGNVTRRAPPGFDGSQGWGAPIAGYNEPGIPTPKAMASTMSELLGVSRNPWSNFASPLIKLDSGILTYPFGRGKLVA